MTLPFIKMHGLGNDYVYIDCFQKRIAEYIAKADLPALARHVSDRHFGIGSDGLVLMIPTPDADAQMRIFNADGSEAQMCGNAIRCVAKYLYESGICPKLQMQIQTLAGMRSLSLLVADSRVYQVTVNMGVPTIEPRVLSCEAGTIDYTAVQIGNPHAVFFCDAIPQLPQDTNVEFVLVRNNKEIDVRVIERGSGETLACGTGACASAVAAIQQGLTDRNVTVHLPGGDMNVQWRDNIYPVYMTGPATEVFRGELTIDN